MQSLMQELRFSLRQIRRSPDSWYRGAHACACVGANTGSFAAGPGAAAVAAGASAGQLVILSTRQAWEGHSSDHGAGVEKSFSYPMYPDLRDRGRHRRSVATPIDRGRIGATSIDLADAEIVSGNYFNVLGVAAAQGRLLTANDDTTPRRQSGRGAELSLLEDASRVGYAGGWTDAFHQRLPDIRSSACLRRSSRVRCGGRCQMFRSDVDAGPGDTGKGQPMQNHKDRWMNSSWRCLTSRGEHRSRAASIGSRSLRKTGPIRGYSSSDPCGSAVGCPCRVHLVQHRHRNENIWHLPPNRTLNSGADTPMI